MRLRELRARAQQILDEQGQLDALDWVWILSELACLKDREADGLYGIIEVKGGRVLAWWCC
jgi:hypothetical protein